MPTPRPANAWNIQVVGSGQNTAGNTIEVLGSMPPQTGMPVFLMNFPITPKRVVNLIDPNTGLVTVAATGTAADQLFQRAYPWQVQVLAADAVPYGWPNLSGSMVYGHTTPGATGNPARGVDLMPGGGFIYG